MEICPLTNHWVDFKQEGSKMLFFYENPILGTVKWTDVAWGMRETLTDSNKDIIKGIIVNRRIKGEQPLEIDSRLLNQLDNLAIPYDFELRARHFLQYLYDDNGKAYKQHLINSSTNNAITYSSREEFEGIIRYLKAEGFIEYEKLTQTNTANFYTGLSITKGGIGEIEKGLPKMPLFSLVDQKITTGDKDIDGKIDHARELFFGEPHTIDKMRSACETLIFIIEPLRKELDSLFKGDTEYFFRIVNEFTIRHNKERTRSIENSEQLEWVFYSLLNTINTYIKMRKRLG